MIYDINGNRLNACYGINEDRLNKAYGINGEAVFTGELNFDDLRRVPYMELTVDESDVAQTYMGGYIEIQPDSWDGTVVTGDTVDNSDATAWGFPYSLSAESKAAIKQEILSGGEYGIRYIRFPLGFGYRGYRNIDETTGLARNIGERWNGQNASLRDWFDAISAAGGGLAPEYWCFAPHWLTGGAYYNESVNNYLCAGGSYAQTVSLASIRDTDPTQYAQQIDAFTDAVVDDLEYLHQNIAPVRMFGLNGEPHGAKAKYGKSGFEDAQTYNDVLEVLWPKVQASAILSAWNGKTNTVLLHVASSNEKPPFDGIASVFIANHADWIWGYSYDAYMTRINGSTVANGAEFYREDGWKNKVKGNRDNVFTCEYEYFSDVVADDYRIGNNMDRLCYELTFGGAKVIMPIIHICKPTGQDLSDTNTRGYCLYAADMSDGSYTTNDWAYRSWKMFNDNLPVDAEILTAKSTAGYTGLVIARHNGKLILFMSHGSYGDAAQIVLTFDSEKTFTGKAYSLEYCGDKVQSKTGKEISFKVPAHAGIVWHEQ